MIILSATKCIAIIPHKLSKDVLSPVHQIQSYEGHVRVYVA